LIKLVQGGLAFGMFDLEYPYQSARIKMKPGEQILFYTDGVTEAMNHYNEEFSDEKLELFFMDTNSLTAGKFINRLIEEVKMHTKDTPQSDDITVLYLTRNMK